jgi:hypothetical protein
MRALSAVNRHVLMFLSDKRAFLFARINPSSGFEHPPIFRPASCSGHSRRDPAGLGWDFNQVGESTAASRRLFVLN